MHSKKQLAHQLRLYLEHEGITQVEATHKKHLNVSQPTISRVLNETWKRPTPVIFALAKKLNVELFEYHNPSENQKIMNALRDVWDGSEESALLISTVIRNIPRLVNLK